MLGTHDWASGADGPELTALTGRTSDGVRIQMEVLDGRLQSFDTHVKVHCLNGETRQWRWYPADGVPVPFHQVGRHFRVIERSSLTSRTPVSYGNSMYGVLTEDGRTAYGTIWARVMWTLRHGVVDCQGTARFSVRARD